MATNPQSLTLSYHSRSLPHVTVERKQHIMAGNSGRQRLLIAKPHSFTLGEKKHEWNCSSTSTS